MAGRCCAVGLHAGVKGVGGPVTRGGQGKGRGPVRCAPVVVAPVGARGRGSPMVGSPSPWWSTPPWRGPSVRCAREGRRGRAVALGGRGRRPGSGPGVGGHGCGVRVSRGRAAVWLRTRGQRAKGNRARGRPIASGRGSHRCRGRRATAPHAAASRGRRWWYACDLSARFGSANHHVRQ